MITRCTQRIYAAQIIHGFKRARLQPPLRNSGLFKCWITMTNGQRVTTGKQNNNSGFVFLYHTIIKLGWTTKRGSRAWVSPAPLICGFQHAPMFVWKFICAGSAALPQNLYSKAMGERVDLNTVMQTHHYTLREIGMCACVLVFTPFLKMFSLFLAYHTFSVLPSVFPIWTCASALGVFLGWIQWHTHSCLHVCVSHIDVHMVISKFSFTSLLPKVWAQLRWLYSPL